MHPLDPYTYILVDRLAVNHRSDDEWFEWFSTADRRVASTKVGEVWISTIFGGIDRSYGYEPQPLVFETHIFDDSEDSKLDGWEELAATWEQAEQVHARAVEMVKQAQGREL